MLLRLTLSKNLWRTIHSHCCNILGFNRMVSGIYICLARFKLRISHRSSEFNANAKNLLFLLICIRFGVLRSRLLGSLRNAPQLGGVLRDDPKNGCDRDDIRFGASLFTDHLFSLQRPSRALLLARALVDVFQKNEKKNKERLCTG